MAKATKDLTGTQEFVLQYKDKRRGYLQKPLATRKKESALEEANLLWEKLCRNSTHGELSDPSLEVCEKDASPIVDKPRLSQKIQDVALRRDEEYFLGYTLQKQSGDVTTILELSREVNYFSKAQITARGVWKCTKAIERISLARVERVCIGKRIIGTFNMEELEELAK
jgi:hypothetical protein